MANAEVLKNIYLFKSLDANELSKLSNIVTEKNYMPGQDIFIAGQEAKSFFVIQMGTVKIYSNSASGNDVNITNLGTGSHFGEMPIVDQGKRSATAQATESTKLLEVEYEKLKELLAANESMAHKFYRDLARYLAGRLRETTENLKTAKELRLKHF